MMYPAIFRLSQRRKTPPSLRTACTVATGALSQQSLHAAHCLMPLITAFVVMCSIIILDMLESRLSAL
jgi:hypothetical protein